MGSPASALVPWTVLPHSLCPCGPHVPPLPWQHFLAAPLPPQARDVYEEAIRTVMTVRDFTQVFDSYAQFEESMIAAKMETASELGREEEGELLGRVGWGTSECLWGRARRASPISGASREGGWVDTGGVSWRPAKTGHISGLGLGWVGREGWVHSGVSLEGPEHLAEGWRDSGLGDGSGCVLRPSPHCPGRSRGSQMTWT